MQESIASIIAQTYPNIELIIIDDGSKDTTWQKICDMQDACKARFVNVDFSTQENCGVCITLNRLLDKSQGDYVFLIASDDRAIPETIEKEYAFLSQNPEYALVVGDNDIIDSEGKRCFWDNAHNNVYTEEGAAFLSMSDYLMRVHTSIDFLSKDFGSYISLLHGNYIPNGYLIRKSIFDTILRWTPEAPLEDYFLMLQISKYAKMKFLPDTLYQYRYHGANTNTVSPTHMADITLQTLLFEFKNFCPFMYHFIASLAAERDSLLAELNNRSAKITDGAVA